MPDDASRGDKPRRAPLLDTGADPAPVDPPTALDTAPIAGEEPRLAVREDAAPPEGGPAPAPPRDGAFERELEPTDPDDHDASDPPDGPRTG